MKDSTKDRTVSETASLHEKAVQAVASGAVAPVPKRPRKPAQKATTTGLDKHLKVHPQVWMKAQELLAGSYTKIEVIDETTVVVR